MTGSSRAGSGTDPLRVCVRESRPPTERERPRAVGPCHRYSGCGRLASGRQSTADRIHQTCRSLWQSQGGDARARRPREDSSRLSESPLLGRFQFRGLVRGGYVRCKCSGRQGTVCAAGNASLKSRRKIQPKPYGCTFPSFDILRGALGGPCASFGSLLAADIISS
jgi:hypothetical protein